MLPELLQALEALLADVRVRGVDEREFRRCSVYGEREIHGTAARRSGDRQPEWPDRTVTIWNADEHKAVSGAWEPIRSVGARLDDLALIGNSNAGNSALARIAPAVAVRIFEDAAGDRRPAPGLRNNTPEKQRQQRDGSSHERHCAVDDVASRPTISTTLALAGTFCSALTNS